MADELDHYRQLLMDDRRATHALAAEARAALAQPEPQGPTDEEPTDQEIEEWADAAAEVPLEEMDPEVHGWRRCFKSDEFSETIRAALARWGRPAIEPDEPAVPDGREPASVADQPTDKELLELMPEPTAVELWELYDEMGGVPEDSAWCLNYARAVLNRWGRPAIEPVPQQEDVHYAWELHDAEGEWQAGGSANSLEDVQREGNRYLQTYSQDGPHKLIIERHCVTTIEPVPKQEAEQ
jgi:hypothetical protein